MDVVHVITREEICTQSNIDLVSLDALNYDNLPNFLQFPLAVKTTGMTLLLKILICVLLSILYPIGFMILLIIVAMIRAYRKERLTDNDIVFYAVFYTFFFITVVGYKLFLSYSDSIIYEDVMYI